MKSKGRIEYGWCPLCTSQKISRLRTSDCGAHPLYDRIIDRAMLWMRCDFCNHVFTNGYFSEEVNDVLFSKSNPHQLVGANAEQMRPVSAQIVEKVLSEHVYVLNTPPGEWLDIGFGNGSLLFTAQEYGFKPVGLEVRGKNVEMLQKHGIDAFSVSNTVQFNERFSVVSMCDVLEHMPFPADSLVQANKYLRFGGLLFLSMPNMDAHIWKLLDQNGSNPYWGELEHFHNFGRDRLYKLLKETGFQAIQYGISQRYRAGMEVIARKVD